MACMGLSYLADTPHAKPPNLSEIRIPEGGHELIRANPPLSHGEK